jgi:SAM-dependent methyltransferase
MAQNIYDNAEFFAGYSKLERSIRGLDGAPEWPSIRALLPDLCSKRVLDLGCGFGWFARWAMQHEAACVLGLDISETMIARAKASTNDPNIHYRIADLEHVKLPEAEFDFAYSSLALHYIEDFTGLVRNVRQALVGGAYFVFSIEHPIYMAPTKPRWLVDEHGRRTWPVDRYSLEGPRSTDWFAMGVLKQHRTIGTTLNTLISAGFVVRHVQEWAPTAEQLAAHPDLADEVDRPMMLIVSAQC